MGKKQRQKGCKPAAAESAQPKIMSWKDIAACREFDAKRDLELEQYMREKGMVETGSTRQPSAPLTAADLAGVPPEMQNDMLGEKLFPLVEKHEPELAGKITALLLDVELSRFR